MDRLTRLSRNVVDEVRELAAAIAALLVGLPLLPPERPVPPPFLLAIWRGSRRRRRRLFLAAHTTRGGGGQRTAARVRTAEELLAVAASLSGRCEQAHRGTDARWAVHPRVDPREEGGQISWGYFYTDEGTLGSIRQADGTCRRLETCACRG